MGIPLFEHGPWTEEEWLALGETSDKVELFDGSLLVTPAPTPRHQDASSLLWMTLRPAAHAAGLLVHQHVNVRLKPDRIPIPDLAIVGPGDTREPIIDVGRVRLVCEIVSPGNGATDRVLKMHYYAEAGIPWYLLVEQEPLSLALFRLDGAHYVPGAKAEVGSVLRMTEPVRVDLDPAALA